MCDVEVRPQEAADDFAEQRSIAYILIDNVVDGRRARWNGLAGMHQRIHGVGDASAAHHVDAGDLDDCILGGINPGGLDVDYADQGAGSLGCDCRRGVAHEVVNVCGRVVTSSERGGRAAPARMRKQGQVALAEPDGVGFSPPLPAPQAPLALHELD